MKFELEHAALTDCGLVRHHNEDNWSADSTAGIYVVADGLGGHTAGELASKIVVEALPLLLKPRLPAIGSLAGVTDTVREAVREVSRQVFQETQKDPTLYGMGATVVMAVVRQTSALVAHLGDSRAYRFRHGLLERLTRDHSVVQLLVDYGEITAEQAAIHPARGCVTRSVGMTGEAMPECRLIDLDPGDRLLLCSDGLVGMVSDTGIYEILAQGGSLETVCHRLVEAANDAGGRDNITVLLVAGKGES